MSGAIIPLITPIDGNPLGLDFTDPVFLLDSAGRKITDSRGRPIVVYNKCQFLTDSRGRRIKDSLGQEIQVNVTDLGIEIDNLFEFTLPPDIDVDWRVVGVGRTGVIPDLSANRVNAVTTHGVVAGLGAGSQTAALQAAIDAEAANRTPGSESTTTRQVFLPAGDYLLSTQLRVVGVELVGEPGTVLHVSSNPTFDAGQGITRNCDVDDVTIAKGATSATLSGAEASYFSTGQAFLSQEDSAGVDSVGVDGLWTTNGFTPVRNKGYAIDVVSRVDHGDGTYTVTWHDPAPFSMTGAIKAHRYGVVSKYAGIRDLTIRSVDYDNPIDTGVQFFRCEHTWIKDVTLKMFNTRHVYLQDTSNITIEGCNFEESRQLVPNGGYGIEVQGFPARCLIRDNVVVGIRSPIVISGGSHNAWLENYCAFPVNLNSEILNQTVSMHAAHPRANLLEGNIIDGAFSADNSHGNSAGNVLFRNVITGRAFDARHGAVTKTRNIAARLDQKAFEYVIAGNVLGWSGMGGVYEVQAPDQIDESQPAIHRWQYASDGNRFGDLTDLNLTLTANYDYINNATQYDENGAVSLPDSLYYTSGNLPAHLPVVNFQTGALNATALPAKARFEAAGGRESLIMANESSLVLINTHSVVPVRHQDVYVNTTTLTAYSAVYENRLYVYDINPITKELLFIKQVSGGHQIVAYFIAEFDGVLWVGGENGVLQSFIPADNDATAVQYADIGTRVLDIQYNGTFLIVTSRDAIHSIEHTGGGAWVIRDTLILEGDTFAAVVDGNDIFASDRTTAGHIYHVTIDGSGNLTNQGIVANSADARRAMWVDSNHLYAGIQGTPAIRHYTRSGATLTAQLDYSLPAMPNTIRRNENRFYVATNNNELVVFDINTVDGTLTERARTTGLTDGEGAYPFGNYYVAYARYGSGLSILEDV